LTSSDLSLLLIRFTNYRPKQLLATTSTISAPSNITLLRVDFRSQFSRLLLLRTTPLRSKRRILRFDNHTSSFLSIADLVLVDSRPAYQFFQFHIRYISVCACASGYAQRLQRSLSESIGFSSIQQPNLISSNSGTGRDSIYPKRFAHCYRPRPVFDRTAVRTPRQKRSQVRQGLHHNLPAHRQVKEWFMLRYPVLNWLYRRHKIT